MGLGFLLTDSQNNGRTDRILLAIVVLAVIGKATDAGASGNMFRLFAVMLLADAVVFAFGFAWLLTVAGLVLQAGGTLPGWIDAGNLVGSAYQAAVEPFILWDILKLAFAALTVAGLWSLLRRKTA